MNWLAHTTRRLSALVRTLTPDCRHASHLQAKALDQKLPLAQRLGLRLHLFICKWCRRYGKQLGFFRAAADYPTDQPLVAPKSLSPDARARIHQNLRTLKQP